MSFEAKAAGDTDLISRFHYRQISSPIDLTSLLTSNEGLTVAYYVLPRHEPWRDGPAVGYFFLGLGAFVGVLFEVRDELRLVKTRLPSSQLTP